MSTCRILTHVRGLHGIVPELHRIQYSVKWVGTYYHNRKVASSLEFLPHPTRTPLHL